MVHSVVLYVLRVTDFHQIHVQRGIYSQNVCELIIMQGKLGSLQIKAAETRSTLKEI
jgi:hypothetical protein